MFQKSLRAGFILCVVFALTLPVVANASPASPGPTTSPTLVPFPIDPVDPPADPVVEDIDHVKSGSDERIEVENQITQQGSGTGVFVPQQDGNSQQVNVKPAPDNDGFTEDTFLISSTKVPKNMRQYKRIKRNLKRKALGKAARSLSKKRRKGKRAIRFKSQFKNRTIKLMLADLESRSSEPEQVRKLFFEFAVKTFVGTIKRPTQQSVERIIHSSRATQLSSNRSAPKYTFRPDKLTKIPHNPTSGNQIFLRSGPNDPNYGEQWGLQKIGAYDAQDLCRTNERPIIGFVGAGGNYNHEDIVGNLWVNSAEVPANGIDDDRNGYVDDNFGWDFSDNDNSPMAEGYNGTTDGEAIATMDAGIVGAVTNNSVGIAGIAPDVQMLFTRGETVRDMGAAIMYALWRGAKVIHTSYTHSDPYGDDKLSIEIAKVSGIPVIAGTGEYDTQTISKSYPGAYEGALSVTSADQNDLVPIGRCESNDPADQYYCQSNIGDWIDYIAPGMNIYSTDYSSNNTFPNDMYGMEPLSSSLAAAHVTGVVATMLSKNPDLTADEIKEILELSSDIILDQSDVMGLGVKRVNALRALELVCSGSIPQDHKTIDILPNSPIDPELPAVVNGSEPIEFSANVTGVNIGVPYIAELYFDGSEAPTRVAVSPRPGAPVTFDPIDVRNHGITENGFFVVRVRVYDIDETFFETQEIFFNRFEDLEDRSITIVSPAEDSAIYQEGATRFRFGFQGYTGTRRTVTLRMNGGEYVREIDPTLYRDGNFFVDFHVRVIDPPINATQLGWYQFSANIVQDGAAPEQVLSRVQVVDFSSAPVTLDGPEYRKITGSQVGFRFQVNNNVVPDPDNARYQLLLNGRVIFDRDEGGAGVVTFFTAASQAEYIGMHDIKGRVISNGITVDTPSIPMFFSEMRRPPNDQYPFEQHIKMEYQSLQGEPATHFFDESFGPAQVNLKRFEMITRDPNNPAQELHWVSTFVPGSGTNDERRNLTVQKFFEYRGGPLNDRFIEAVETYFYTNQATGNPMRDIYYHDENFVYEPHISEKKFARLYLDARGRLFQYHTEDNYDDLGRGLSFSRVDIDPDTGNWTYFKNEEMVHFDGRNVPSQTSSRSRFSDGSDIRGTFENIIYEHSENSLCEDRVAFSTIRNFESSWSDTNFSQVENIHCLEVCDEDNFATVYEERNYDFSDGVLMSPPPPPIFHDPFCIFEVR